jgi:hypothetical protein
VRSHPWWVGTRYSPRAAVRSHSLGIIICEPNRSESGASNTSCVPPPDQGGLGHIREAGGTAILRPKLEKTSSFQVVLCDLRLFASRAVIHCKSLAGSYGVARFRTLKPIETNWCSLDISLRERQQVCIGIQVFRPGGRPPTRAKMTCSCPTHTSDDGCTLCQ